MTYSIDRDDRLAAFSETWSVFANANGGVALDPAWLTGRVIWDFISDSTTVHLYQVMVQRVRREGQPITFQFRCDAPDRRRLLEMAMTPGPAGAVQFIVTPVRDEPRPPVSLLSAARPTGSGLISMCAWCKRVHTGGGTWIEVEAAIDALGLFHARHLPRVSHGICPSCQTAMLRLTGQAAAGPGMLTLGPLPGDDGA